MYRLLPILLAGLLLAPSALADRRQAGDGSLVVSDASARSIVLKGNGLVFGHIQQGTLTVQSYSAADTNAPQISGAVPRIVGNTVVYAGSDIRFLLPNGRYSLRIDGTGIDISAVGRGSIVAAGLGTIFDGTLSVNNGKPQALGVVTASATFNGASNVPAATAASVAGKDKAQDRSQDRGH